MTIVYIVEDITIRGGVERIVSDKANRFAQLGHQVHIVSVFHSAEAPLYAIDTRISLHSLDVARSRHHTLPESLRIFAQACWRYNRLIRTLHPDVCFYAWILGALLLCTSLHPGRKIYEQHSAYDITPYKPLLRWMQRRADTVVCLTQGDARNFTVARQVRVIPNFTPIPTIQVSDYTVHRAVAMGRLIEVKGFDRLIDAWSQVIGQHPDWQLDIYGEGEWRKRLQQQIDQLHLGHSIHLCGITQHVSETLAQYSLQLVTSHNEGHPMVLCEGQAVGLPAICFDFQYGASEVIVGDRNGWLIPQDNLPAFCKALHSAMSDSDLLQQKGIQARQLAQRFSPDTLFPLWIDFLQ